MVVVAGVLLTLGLLAFLLGGALGAVHDDWRVAAVTLQLLGAVAVFTAVPCIAYTVGATR
jgi:hypothetical protein